MQSLMGETPKTALHRCSLLPAPCFRDNNYSHKIITYLLRNRCFDQTN
ncbi:hypothetical protein [Moorena sp. SIO3F7]|nr:hypothetical protein [Moorena sp. SIO3F7]NEQ00831.1 hypothetical protein [Moorena sp. SIO3F7]